MEAIQVELKRLLPHGGISIIAKKLGITGSAVSQALRDANPGHPAVREALKLAEASGALVAAQQLAKLTHIAKAA